MYIPKKSCLTPWLQGGRDCQDGRWLGLEVIGTVTVKVTKRDETVRALEAVRYVSEAWYNLIFIGVLDEEGYQIQVQQGIVTVSQEDRVILKDKKCGRIYKLKEGTKFEVEFQG